MKTLMILPILLAAMLAGPVAAFGQTRVDKKVERVIKKIEKQTRKLQELQGESIRPIERDVVVIDTENLNRIREKAMQEREMERARAEEFRQQWRENSEALREEAEEFREQAREQAEIAREKYRQERDKFRQELEENLENFRDEKGNYYYKYKAPNFEFEWKSPKLPEFRGLPYLSDLGDFRFEFPENLHGIYVLNSDQDVLTIDKNLTDETNSADFSYELKEGASSMSLSVNGSIESGKVVITIKKPGGESFNEYVLSPLANVNWQQNLNFDDQDESAYVGKWTVSVAAENAKGHYQVRMRAR